MHDRQKKQFSERFGFKLICKEIFYEKHTTIVGHIAKSLSSVKCNKDDTRILQILPD